MKGVKKERFKGERPQWTGRVNPQWDDLDKIGRRRTPKVYTVWNDLFHEGVGPNFQNNVMFRIMEHPQHFFMICTKRPKRALEYFSGQYAVGGSPFQTGSFRKNLMIMTTAENQEMADLRIPVLLQIPGVLHGVSVEPGLSFFLRAGESGRQGAMQGRKRFAFTTMAAPWNLPGKRSWRKKSGVVWSTTNSTLF